LSCRGRTKRRSDSISSPVGPGGHIEHASRFRCCTQTTLSCKSVSLQTANLGLAICSVRRRAPAMQQILIQCIWIQQRYSRSVQTHQIQQQRCDAGRYSRYSRYSSDTAAIQQRYSRDTAEIQQIQQIQQRSSRDTAAIQQRYSSDTAQIQHRYSTNTVTPRAHTSVPRNIVPDTVRIQRRYNTKQRIQCIAGALVRRVLRNQTTYLTRGVELSSTNWLCNIICFCDGQGDIGSTSRVDSTLAYNRTGLAPSHSLPLADGLWWWGDAISSER
jgi:hypothetical protein